MLALGNDKLMECEPLTLRAVDATRRHVAHAAFSVALTTHDAVIASMLLLDTVLSLIQAQASTVCLPAFWLLAVRGSGEAHAELRGLSRSARAEALVPLMCFDAPLRAVE